MPAAPFLALDDTIRLLAGRFVGPHTLSRRGELQRHRLRTRLEDESSALAPFPSAIHGDLHGVDGGMHGVGLKR